MVESRLLLLLLLLVLLLLLLVVASLPSSATSDSALAFGSHGKRLPRLHHVAS
jgi:hypothetical protein